MPINAGLARRLDESTRMVWVEIADESAAQRSSTSARPPRQRTRPGLCCVVDNTFATPYLQRPLELGADVVVHSTTKYLGGHSDVVGGFAGTSDDALAERLAFLQNALGAVPGPFDSWLVLARPEDARAAHAPALRERARRVAGWLGEHPGVERVRYPGLPVASPARARDAARWTTSAAWSASSSPDREAGRATACWQRRGSGRSARASAASRA